MIEPLAFATTLICIAFGLVLLARGLAGQHRWTVARPVLIGTEVAVLVQAVAVLVSLGAGHRPGETVTHLAYLVTSVLVAPVIALQTAHDDGRWAGVLNGIGLLLLAVIVVRMQTTWRPLGG